MKAIKIPERVKANPELTAALTAILQSGNVDEVLKQAAKIAKPPEPPRPKMSRNMRQLIDTFDEAAMYHGWQRDQGTGKEVENAAKHYEESKLALEEAVAQLEWDLAKETDG